MSNTTINWEMRNGSMAAMRDDGRLAVWLCYVLHSNTRNRAWPSVETIMKETGWGRHAVCNAKAWLQDNGALVKVPFDKRSDDEIKLHQRQEIMQVTGLLIVDGRECRTLYSNSALEAPLSTEINSAPTKSFTSALEGITSSEGSTKEDITQSVVLNENGSGWIFSMYMDIFKEDVISKERDFLRELAGVYQREDIREAMTITKLSNARKRIVTKVAYTNGILQSWAKNGKDAPTQPAPLQRAPSLESLGYKVVR